MLRLSRISIALSLIAVAVNGFHVESVKSDAKINIGVNGIHVETVESNTKINIGVNGILVETVESFDNGYLSLFIWACTEG